MEVASHLEVDTQLQSRQSSILLLSLCLPKSFSVLQHEAMQVWVLFAGDEVGSDWF